MLASTIIDLEIKPDVKGKAEIAKAPMIPHIAVKGIVLYKPPTSVHLYLLIM